jgi:hypothetical protein
MEQRHQRELEALRHKVWEGQGEGVVDLWDIRLRWLLGWCPCRWPPSSPGRRPARRVPRPPLTCPPASSRCPCGGPTSCARGPFCPSNHNALTVAPTPLFSNVGSCIHLCGHFAQNWLRSHFPTSPPIESPSWSPLYNLRDQPPTAFAGKGVPIIFLLIVRRMHLHQRAQRIGG